VVVGITSAKGFSASRSNRLPFRIALISIPFAMNNQNVRLAFPALVSLIITLQIHAQEKLPVLKVGSQIYTNVTITEVTATDIYFSFNRGMASAKLKNLEPAMQSHFHYDAARAEARAQEQKAAAAQYRPQGATATNRSAPSADVKSNGAASGLKAEMDDAIARVREIVNQPVTALTRTPEMETATYSPGWFHEGAEKPDFNKVDVRTTQQLNYGQHKYVTSDLNPGVVFVGNELEFNPMTKYFYTDRSVPKKKLTEVEMLEINRLYRIIGHDEEELGRLQKH